MTEKRSLVDELRRRGVLRAGAIYLAGAWLAIEVADTVFPRLGIPDWGITLVVWSAVLAFPIVIALAWIFDFGRSGVRREEGVAPAVPGSRVLLVGAALLTIALGAGAWAAWLRPEAEAVPLDENMVAVLPFRVPGSSTALHDLREGMVDLLHTKLTGEVGPRAVDPRTLISAWRMAAGSSDRELPEDSALEVARRTGAGRAVLGAVVAAGSNLTLTATLVNVADDGDRKSTEVTGPTDSLPALVDRLAAQLLALETGHDATQVGPLTGTSLPALRHYLAGEASYRRGEYGDALESFRQALDLDSTFAMAAFGFERSAPWVGGWEDARERARNIAWRNRDRLTRFDRTHLIGRIGPRYPEHPTARELLDARMEAAELMPDRAEVLYEVADLYFHHGFVLGEADPLRKAYEGFADAMALDPNFAAPLQHSIMIAGLIGDTAGLRALAARAAAGGPGSLGSYAEWRTAATTNDTAELRRLRSAFANWDDGSWDFISGDAAENGFLIEDALATNDLRLARAATRGEQRVRLQDRYALAVNAGRPAEALQLLERIEPLALDPAWTHRRAILDALYAGGDSARAVQAAATLDATRTDDSELALLNECMAAQWRAWQGSPVASGLVARVRAGAGSGRGLNGSLLEVCAGVLDALAGNAGALERLDDLLRTGPYTGIIEGDHPYYANIALAHLFEQNGDIERALDAARRRSYYHGYVSETARHFLLEARFAARLGRRDEAIEAYRRYLDLRAEAEPSRFPEVEQARAELQALLAPG